MGDEAFACKWENKWPGFWKERAVRPLHTLSGTEGPCLLQGGGIKVQKFPPLPQAIRHRKVEQVPHLVVVVLRTTGRRYELFETGET